MNVVGVDENLISVSRVLRDQNVFAVFSPFSGTENVGTETVNKLFKIIINVFIGRHLEG